MENLLGINIAMDTEEKKWRTVPYLARRYPPSDDLIWYEGTDYLDIIGTIQNGDVAASPVRSRDNAKKQALEDDVRLYPTTIYSYGPRNQLQHDRGIVYQRHNKGIPILQICDVKLQHGSTNGVKYSWKLVEVTNEECKLEIEHSDEGEQVKEFVRFCFVNYTDKLLSCIVDGYKVSYVLHTDAIRLGLKLEIALSSPLSALDFNNVHGEVNLEIERDGNPYTIHLLPEQCPAKKPKPSLSSISFEIIRNVPRNLHDCMKLVVKLKDSNGMLIVDAYHHIFSYKIPVDVEDYLQFDNGHIKNEINIFWGCCVGVGKGLCTEVCTCEPVEFIGFCQPGEGGCSKDAEE